MNMVGHDHEPHANGAILLKHFIEPTQQNAFGVIVIQKLAPAKDGKCDEVHIQPVINNSSLVFHELNLEQRQLKQQLLVAVPPR